MKSCVLPFRFFAIDVLHVPIETPTHKPYFASGTMCFTFQPSNSEAENCKTIFCFAMTTCFTFQTCSGEAED